MCDYITNTESDLKKQSTTSASSLTEFRQSLQNYRNSRSTPINDEQIKANDEQKWRLSYLKDQFESLQLHTLFKRYTERINHSYFAQFLSLQIILSTTHFLLVLIINVGHMTLVLPDIILYLLTAILALVVLLFTDCYGKNNRKVLKFSTLSAFVLIFFMNAFIPFYQMISSELGYIRPAYTIHLIISTYVFLNIKSNLVTIIVGVFVSISHVITLIITVNINSAKLWQTILTEIIFLICVNGLGIYYRYMNEIVKRRSFLDRRAYLETTLQLKFEKEQQDQLMSSIIPKHIIEVVRSDIMKYWDYIETVNKIPREKPFKNPYVQEHNDVSILFADIVNYTEMTSSLDTNDLLQTLNDLFGQFDDASEELKVFRIKFLGDCYYCVAGLPPDPAPNHAEACVDLGLQMIEIISDVSSVRNLNINMRIGIHSGKITSGIIGCIKWQYDIWSNDVDIANKMETEGCAGKVHITNKTKNLLKKDYEIVPTDKGETVLQFKQNNITTFLIFPKPETVLSDSSEAHNNFEDFLNQHKYTQNEKSTNFELRSNENDLLNMWQNKHGNSQGVTNVLDNQRRDTIYSKRSLVNNVHKKLTASSRTSDRKLIVANGKRRTAFMNNTIKRYEERLKETNYELERTIENMSLTKYEQWFKVNEINRWLVTFRNLKTEMNFIKMPDPLFKYYLLCEILLIIFLFIMKNLTSSKWNWSSWSVYSTLTIIIFLFLPLTWSHYLWSRHVSKYEIDSPKNKIIQFFYVKSKIVTNNVTARLLIYTIACIMFSICVFSEMIPCKQAMENRNFNLERENLLMLIFKFSSANATSEVECILPWYMTETCALAIIMSFVFLKMYIWIKFVYAMIITTIYIYCVWHFSELFYNDNETFNYSLKPQLSHTICVLFLTITLHFIDRQTEYLNKLDYLWYETLIKERGETTSLQFVNNMLLQNILPIHVAGLYLDVNRQLRSPNDLYNEKYDSVAVMFASLVNYYTEYNDETTFLKIMNKIICEFDTLSVSNSFGRPVEKIKLAKWTYMAACGLVPGLGNIENIRRDQNNHSVISLIKFASCLLKTLNSEPILGCQLRIGISYGRVAAGVVGSKKPLYDIWGDPVNMASRMDTTGKANHIQVLHETAEIIQEYGYVCHYRGKIKVKGRDGVLPTYFVALDENFDLIRQDNYN